MLQDDYAAGYQEIQTIGQQPALRQPLPQQQGSSVFDSAQVRQPSVPSGMVRTVQPERSAQMRLQPVPLQLSTTDLEYNGGLVYRIARVRCTPRSITIETSARTRSPVARIRCAEPYSLVPVRPEESEPFFTLDSSVPGLTATPDCERFAGYRDDASVPAQVRAICYQARTTEMTSFVSMAREAMASGQPLLLLDGWTNSERGAGAEVIFRAYEMSSSQ
jgi:hypothetical protein